MQDRPHVHYIDLVWECGAKLHVRPVGLLSRRCGDSITCLEGSVVWQSNVYEMFFEQSMRAGMLSQEDTSLACGWCLSHRTSDICTLRRSAQPTTLESSLKHWLCIGVSSHRHSVWTGGVALARWSM